MSVVSRDPALDGGCLVNTQKYVQQVLLAFFQAEFIAFNNLMHHILLRAAPHFFSMSPGK